MALAYGAATALPFGGVSIITGAALAAIPVTIGVFGELGLDHLHLSEKTRVLAKSALWLTLTIATVVVAAVLCSSLFALFIAVPVIAMFALSMGREALKERPALAKAGIEINV